MFSTYKIEALNSMKQTVATLSTEVEKSQSYTDKVRNGKVAGVVNGTDFQLVQKNGVVNF